MYFEVSVVIDRPVAIVFAFFKDKHKFTQEKDSSVLIIEKTTRGPVCVGTCYRELVRMLPFYTEEILSEISSYQPEKLIEECFESRIMKGRLVYQFVVEGEKTRLLQQEQLSMRGLLNLFQWFIQRSFPRKLQERLDGIKKILERNWTPIIDE